MNVSTPKQAYSQAAPDFAAGRSACTGAPVSWSPTTVVPLVKQAKPKGKAGTSKQAKKAAKKPAPKVKKKKKVRH